MPSLQIGRLVPGESRTNPTAQHLQRWTPPRRFVGFRFCALDHRNPTSGETGLEQFYESGGRNWQHTPSSGCKDQPCLQKRSVRQR
jgi:hypothetical protein